MTVKTMSSREIAELTGKQHYDVMRDIRVMCEQLEMAADLRASFEGIYLDSYGREKPCFNLPRRECEILVTGYDVKRRAAVIDRNAYLKCLSTAIPTINSIHLLSQRPYVKSDRR